MKKSLFVLGVLTTLVGCKEESPVDYAIIEGSVTNFEGKELALNQTSGDFKSKITLKADGTFADTLKTEAGPFTLSDGKNKMQFYLEQGDRLKVHYDATDIGNTLSFEGTAAATAKYYEAKKKISDDLEVGKQNIYTLEEAEFLNFIDKVKKGHLDLLAQSQDLPESFLLREKEHIGYEFLYQLNNFELYHGYYTNNREFKASEKVTAQLQDVDLENLQAYRFSSAYKQLLTGTYNQMANAAVAKDSVDQPLALIRAIATNNNPEIKDDLMFDNARVYLSYTDDPKAYFDIYMQHASNDGHKEIIQKDYEKLLTLSAGESSPVFKDYENYAGGTTSLTELQGKYVYIDVWATWCGPCKREIPALKELETDYHDKNITFLSISIDAAKDHDKWTAMVEEKELAGVQLFADNDWNSQFVQDYMIKGIPRFILLDPEGKIVKSNAPRPSSDEIRELFDGLQI